MTVTHNFVQAGEVRLETFEAGPADARPVVLVHGAGSSARIWHSVQTYLADEGIRTLALSMRGAGGSDHTPNDEDYHPSSYARDLVVALDTLAIANFVLVGHSLGTVVASYVTRDHRERVDALMQIAGPAHDRTGSRPGRPPSGRWIAGGYGATEDVTELEHWRSQHLGLPDEVRDQLRRDIDANPEQRLRGQRAPWPGAAEVAATLDVPTLVLLGDGDDVVPPEEPLRYYLGLPEPVRHLQVLHGAGHYPNAQAPRAVARTLRRFLRDEVDRQADRRPGA
jgi:pimeloyl-ACP methyl ester carboxylesterase